MPRLHLLRIGLLASLLALAGQLAFAATVPTLGLVGPATICHAGASHRKPIPLPHDPGCVLCPLCVTLAPPAPALASPPALPRPAIVTTEPITVTPPQAAPPATILAAAQPRGPPFMA